MDINDGGANFDIEMYSDSDFHFDSVFHSDSDFQVDSKSGFESEGADTNSDVSNDMGFVGADADLFDDTRKQAISVGAVTPRESDDDVDWDAFLSGVVMEASGAFHACTAAGNTQLVSISGL